MQAARLYIIQVLGILLLMCGYFIGDQPDRLSQMHFHLSSTDHLVIHKATKSATKEATVHTGKTSHNRSSRRTTTSRHISFDLVMPFESNLSYCFAAPVVYTTPLPETYNYLFYEEINPPPPKCG